MGLFNIFGRKNEDGNYPFTIKKSAKNEAEKELKKIHEKLDDWYNEAKRKEINTMMANNPDFIIRKLIDYVVNLTRTTNQYTTFHLLQDIRENTSCDAVDLIISLQMIYEKDDIVNNIIEISQKKNILNKEDKDKIVDLIIKLIALNEGIKKASRITRGRYYGWIDYFDRENNIRLSDLKSIIDTNNQSIQSIRIGSPIMDDNKLIN